MDVQQKRCRLPGTLEYDARDGVCARQWVMQRPVTGIRPNDGATEQFHHLKRHVLNCYCCTIGVRLRSSYHHREGIPWMQHCHCHHQHFRHRHHCCHDCTCNPDSCSSAHCRSWWCAFRAVQWPPAEHHSPVFERCRMSGRQQQRRPPMPHHHRNSCADRLANGSMWWCHIRPPTDCTNADGTWLMNLTMSMWRSALCLASPQCCAGPRRPESVRHSNGVCGANDGDGDDDDSDSMHSHLCRRQDGFGIQWYEVHVHCRTY